MNNLSVIILAAGQGKRMKSARPKVLFEVGGEPMILSVLRAVKAAVPGAKICVVVGVGREQVEAAVRAHFDDVAFAVQAEPRGTGDAVRAAVDSDWGRTHVKSAPVLILPGDQPLISPDMIRVLAATHVKKVKLRMLTTVLSDATGYGRVVRKPSVKIVEEKDATEAQKKIREVAVSTFLFDPAFLTKEIARLKPNNAQNEYYLTDLVAVAAKTKSVAIEVWPHAEDLAQVNNPWELAEAGRLLNRRTVKHWAMEGVLFQDPATTWVGRDVKLEAGVAVEAGVHLRGQTVIHAGAHIKAGSVIEDSEVFQDAKVGPYAHLRPGSSVGRRAKIGNFVELKKARIGEGTSVAHLSYVGDADVGRDVNIGCGFVTCNFDGRVIDGERKHKTVIEDGVFLGSDCQTVAPVRIGRGAYVASGSTITEDVEAESLAIARSRQVVKPGYAKKLRSGGH